MARAKGAAPGRGAPRSRRGASLHIGAAALGLLGCGGGAAPTSVAPPAASAAAPAASLVPAAVSAAAAPSVAPAAAAPPEPAGAPFPPPGFAPPFPRTAQAGDGTWTALGDGASPPMVRATVHPHSIKRHVYVVVVAIDLRRVELHLVAGTEEPKSKSVPKERRPGLVPAAAQSDLLAVFNGGFMSKHGGYGMMLDGDTFGPPRDDTCAVALTKEGGVRVGAWAELSGTAMSAYRQTPPCLLDKGVVHPALETAEKPRRWGSSETGDVEVRRSALGLDEGGTTLFYGLGEWMTPKLLADAMRAAGAVNTAQLDINWSYTRFLLYKRPSPAEPPEVSSTLIPKIKHAPGEYVVKPASRDFFYLARKH